MSSLLPLLQSGVIRGLLVAAVGLLGSILGLFGVSEVAFAAKGAQVVDALSNFLIASGVAYATYARVALPTPPITEGAAAATVARQAQADEAAGRLPQSGFARPLMLACLLALSLGTFATMQGCQSIGLQEPQNLEQRILYVNKQLEAAANVIGSSVRHGQLTKEQAQEALDLVKQGAVLSDASSFALTKGDIETAEGRLILLTDILAQVQVVLNKRSAK
jgi:hypothetical protein